MIKLWQVQPNLKKIPENINCMSWPSESSEKQGIIQLLCTASRNIPDVFQKANIEKKQNWLLQVDQFPGFPWKLFHRDPLGLFVNIPLAAGASMQLAKYHDCF